MERRDTWVEQAAADAAHMAEQARHLEARIRQMGGDLYPVLEACTIVQQLLGLADAADASLGLLGPVFLEETPDGLRDGGWPVQADAMEAAMETAEAAQMAFQHLLDIWEEAETGLESPDMERASLQAAIESLWQMAME